MKYQVAGIITVRVEAPDARTARTEASKQVNKPVVWIEVEETKNDK